MTAMESSKHVPRLSMTTTHRILAIFTLRSHCEFASVDFVTDSSKLPEWPELHEHELHNQG